MTLWWYTNVMRHFWYYWNNCRNPKLPRIKPARITPEALEWSRKRIEEIESR